jgi:serine/threonine protein phosphatase PrpC
MDTKWRTAAASVTGSRHLRTARNGQDAAAALVAGDLAIAVVCDGCGGSSGSEVGAQLGASLVARAVVKHADVTDWDALFAAVRRDVVAAIDAIAARMPDRERAIREHFLFTVIAAVGRGDEIAVWSIGDGHVAIDGEQRTFGPFRDNEPPYLAYELLDVPARSELVVARGDAVVIATDGACDLTLAHYAVQRYVTHPDLLRRELAVLARVTERIAWDERRVQRQAAVLADDCAVAVLLRGGAS